MHLYITQKEAKGIHGVRSRHHGERKLLEMESLGDSFYICIKMMLTHP